MIKELLLRKHAQKWTFLFASLLTIVFGLNVLLTAAIKLQTVLMYIGMLALLTTLIFFLDFRDRMRNKLLAFPSLIVSILSLIVMLGIISYDNFFILYYVITFASVYYLLALAILGLGILFFVRSIEDWKTNWLSLDIGILSFVIGAFLLVNPWLYSVGLGNFLGMEFVYLGILGLVLTFR